MQLSSHATPAPVPTDPASGAPAPPDGRPEHGRRPGLEARMEAAKRHMDARLTVAALAYEVNTAHIDTMPVDWSRIPTAPAPAPIPPTRPPCPYTTPVAGLLHRASLRLREAGWCAGALVDEEGALCSQGAIRRESGGDRRLEAQAMEVLLEAIRRKFGPSVESVPTFNDAWADGREPTRMMEQASVLADARGI
ncbi:hypothetical protein ABZ341_06670 [Streptomyces sp. NPDC006173]|uniref:DUF6197 family protein n=1 Tax=Streptomyces sp. NPDC006173 TaxID=3155349 RepID=UPI0033C83495